MRTKKKMTALCLSLIMIVTALIPNGLVFAADKEFDEVETNGFYYTLNQILNDDKTEETVTLTLKEKENATIQEVILPDDTLVEYTRQPITYIFTENGEMNFTVRYIENETSEPAELTTQETIVSVNVSGIQAAQIKSDTIDASNPEPQNSEVVKNFDLQSVVRTASGTAPFDTDDEAGNDSSISNSIVRSFDNAQYDMTYSGEISTDINSVDIDVELQLNVEKKYAEFNTEVLSSWLTNIEQKDIDGKCVLTGTTKYAYTAGGTGFQAFAETKVIEVDVKGMNQSSEVIPTFKVKLSGESTWKEKVMATDEEKVIISATPMYDIELVNSTKLGSVGTFDFSTGITNAPNKASGEIYGRLMDYGIAVRLKAQDSDKGMKGFYIPEKTDNLTFKIGTSITESNSPVAIKALFWDHKENKRANTGIYGRDLTNGSTDTGLFAPSLPLTDSTGTGFNSYTVNNGGTWTFTQNADGSIDVALSGATLYDKGGNIKAPTVNGNGSTVISPSPTQGNLYISTAFFEVVVPIDKNSTENKTYQLTVTNHNMSAPYVDGVGNDKISTTQTDITNDSISRDFETFKKGSYGIYHYFAKENQQTKFWGDNLSSNKAGMGLDAYALKGTSIQVVGAFSYAGDRIKDLNAVNLLMRIDNNAMQPSDSSSSGTPASNSVSGATKLLYAAKPGGTGWLSDEEMLATKEENLEYFESMSALKAKYADGVCVAVLAEIRGIQNMSENVQNTIGFNVDIIDSAKQEDVYQTVHTAAFYHADKNITTTDSRLNNSSSDKLNNPTSYIRNDNQYEKAEYNDEHQVITNSANASYSRGASLLIVGVEAGIQKTVDSNSTSFDLSSGITFIPYRLQPVLNVAKGKEGTTIKKVEIIDVIPNQLKITDDTKFYYGDKEITPTLEILDGGSTKLTWVLQNVKAGETLPAITFKAELNFDNIDLKLSKHIVSNTAYISADGDNRVFSSSWASHPNQSAAQAILVVNKSLNLSKQALQPLVEVEGDVKYRIAFTNTNALDYEDYKMLDVLPFNNDANGSKFEGTYRTDAKLTAPSSMELYYTTDETVRSKNASNVDMGLFTKIAPVSEKDGYKSYELPDNTTAVLLGGKLPSMTQYTLDITLHPDSNAGGNVYANSASMIAKGLNILTTAIAKTEVVERSLSGIAWIDKNKNGQIDTTDTKLNELIVKLYQINAATGAEEPAKDVLGNLCETKTDSNGYYKFAKLSSGEYRVKFSGENGNPIQLIDYIITEKNVGSDEALNSKADANLNEEGLMTSAQITGIQLPTLEKMQQDKIHIYEKNFQNFGIYQETVSKSVTKVWVDQNNQDSIRPTEVLVQLYADEKAVGDAVILNADSKWSYTWTGLAKNADGKEIVYSVKETAVPDGYADKVEIGEDGNFTLTNSHKVETVEKTVTKVWDDQNNQDGIRPTEVLVQLYADDKAVGDAVILNADSKWSYTWTGLAKNADGKEIVYSVKETAVPDGYTDKVEIGEDGNFTLINTHTINSKNPANPTVPSNPSKPDSITDAPKTGDDTNLNLFIALFGISAGLLLLLVGKRKKQRDL